MIIYPNPILRKKCKPIKYLDTEIIDKMFQILSKTGNGVALSANQIGYPIAVFVYSLGTNRGVVINPRIISKSKEIIISEEACLSIPGIIGKVERSKSIIIKTINGIETIGGSFAIIFQHEIDHLNGILFIDRIKNLEDFTHIKGVLPDEVAERFI